jgi:pentatricopeptide repeat protein
MIRNFLRAPSLLFRLPMPLWLPAAPFHCSPLLLGGRNDARLAARSLGASKSRPQQSKKARQREKRRRETEERRTSSMPSKAARGGAAGRVAEELEAAAAGGGDGALAPAPRGALATTGSAAAGAHPSPSALAAASRRNRLVLESMLTADAQPELPHEALSKQDGDAWVAALEGGAVPASARLWTHAVRVHAARGEVEKALRAFRAMRAAGFEPATEHAYVALLVAAGEGGVPAVAGEVWGALTRAEARVGRPSPVAWGALIHAHVRGGELEGAFAWLRRAEEAGVPLTAPLWTSLIVGCNSAGRYEMAEDCFNRMRTFHAAPDTVAFNALITSFARRDRAEAAVNVLWDMRDSGVAADTVTYNAVLQAVGRSARPVHAQAARLLAAMAPAGVARDIHSFNAALLARTHRGDVEGAREVFAAALREGLTPTLTTFNTLLTAYARALHPVALRAAARGGGGGGRAALAARQEGDELLALDAAGALSSAERAVAGLPAFPPFQGDAPKSRLVNTADLKGTVDSLLADYYGVPVGDAEGEALEATEEDASALARFEPPLEEYSLPVGNADFLRAAEALVAAGLVDPGLVEDIVEEHSRVPSWDDAAERRRAEELARRHAERLASVETTVVAIAKAEAEAVEAAVRAGKAGARRRFDDVARAAEARAARRAVASHADAAGAPPVELSPSSRLVLEAQARGERLSMRAYLEALEREVMTAAYGPEFEPPGPASKSYDTEGPGEGGGGDGGGGGRRGRRFARASATSEGGGGDGDGGGAPHARKRRWQGLLSRERELADPNASIGGTPVRELFALSTVDWPSARALGAGDDEAGELDPEKLYEHGVSAVKARVAAALAREAAAGGGRGAALLAVGLAPAGEEVRRDGSDEGGGGAAPEVAAARAAASAARDAAAATAAAASAAAAYTAGRGDYTSAAAASQRAYAARVMARVLQVHPLGPLERDLISAADSREQRAARARSGRPPGLLDVIFAAAKLRAAAVAANPAPALAAARAGAVAAGGGGGGGGGDGAAARASLLAQVSRSPAAAAALEAAVGLSGAAMLGAAWAPAGPYPIAPAQRAGALLAEVHAIFYRELPAAGLAPDVVTLNVVLSALCHAGAPRDAYAFLTAEFPRARAAPDARTFRALIRMHALRQRSSDGGARALATMEALRIPADKDCVGMVVHALARDWRLAEALALARRLKFGGAWGPPAALPEFYARLLRHRCRDAGVADPAVPEHPVGWQFSRANMKKRMTKKSRIVRRQATHLRTSRRYGYS